MARDGEAMYKVTSGGNRVRAYKPSKSALRRLRLSVYTRDDFTCLICRRPFPRPDRYDGTDMVWGHGTYLTLDHLKPYRDGGLYAEDNLRTACHPCNSKRGAGDW